LGQQETTISCVYIKVVFLLFFGFGENNTNRFLLFFSWLAQQVLAWRLTKSCNGIEV